MTAKPKSQKGDAKGSAAAHEAGRRNHPSFNPPTAGRVVKELVRIAPHLTLRARERVAVMTVTLNEAVCIAFTLAPFLETADLVIVVDTGSDDGTPEIVSRLFAEHISAGRLELVQLGRLPNYEVSIARQRALDIARAHGCGMILKIDGDDVFYRRGAALLTTLARHVKPRVTHLRCWNHELYQFHAVTDSEFLAALRAGGQDFYRMSFTPCQYRAYRVLDDTYADGRWADEAAGGRPEDIIVPEPHRVLSLPVIAGAHYGWAKPVQRKLDKCRAWRWSEPEHPYVRSLQDTDSWGAPIEPFSHHPESVPEWIDRLEVVSRELSTEAADPGI